MSDWGILAPDDVISPRRSRHLQLPLAVRHFNDRAVPGLGGLWFPMPLLWSVLAVKIAQDRGVSALPVGNAIEARMMLAAAEGKSDPRVRGRRKMAGLTDKSFKNLSRRGTYVVQPLRIAMVQPLVALGFVKGSRYGAFGIAEAGQRLLDLPVMGALLNPLAQWVDGKKSNGLSEALGQLSPDATLPEQVRRVIEAQIFSDRDEDSRRRLALRNRWRVSGTGPSASDLEKAEALDGISKDHWRDMRAGVAFMNLRQAALNVLDALEAKLWARHDHKKATLLSLTQAADLVSTELQRVKELVEQTGARIEAAGEASSLRFVEQLREASDPEILRNLAKRDGTGVRLLNDEVTFGSASVNLKSNSGLSADDATDGPILEEGSNAFAPQLFRLYHLYCLARELEAKPNPGIRAKGEA